MSLESITFGPIGLAQWLVILVALQRLAELAWSRRNEETLRAAGGQEFGAAHYPLIVIVHMAWLIALFAGIAPDAPVHWPLIVIFAGLQILRLWVIASLGPYWTTRVITVPGMPLIRRGPYRWMRHPNYAVVAAEIAILPLAFGAGKTALLFSLLNAIVLGRRIWVENAALASRRVHADSD